MLGAWGQRERQHPLAGAIPQLDDLRVRVGQGGELRARRLPSVVSRMLEIGPHGGVGSQLVELAEALLRGLREQAGQLIRSALRACPSRLYETGLDFSKGDTQKGTDHDNEDRRDEERHTQPKGIPGLRSQGRPPDVTAQAWLRTTWSCYRAGSSRPVEPASRVTLAKRTLSAAVCGVLFGTSTTRHSGYGLRFPRGVPFDTLTE